MKNTGTAIPPTQPIISLIKLPPLGYLSLMQEDARKPPSLLEEIAKSHKRNYLSFPNSFQYSYSCYNLFDIIFIINADYFITTFHFIYIFPWYNSFPIGISQEPLIFYI